MTMDSSNGDRTLLPGTEPVKENSRKSFRASKQPAPALPPRPPWKKLAPVPPPPIPSDGQQAEPLSPSEVVFLHLLEGVRPAAVSARVLHEELPLWSLHDVATALQRLAKRGRLLLHAAADDPADAMWKLLPDRSPIATMSPAPFFLELVRPPRLVDRSAVAFSRCEDFEDPLAVPCCVIARLVPGDPYELRLDGVTVFVHEGNGWQGRARCLLTIRGTSAGEIGHGFYTREPAPDGALFVPVWPGTAVEVRFEGEVVFAEPGE